MVNHAEPDKSIQEIAKALTGSLISVKVYFYYTSSSYFKDRNWFSSTICSYMQRKPGKRIMMLTWLHIKHAIFRWFMLKRKNGNLYSLKRKPLGQSIPILSKLETYIKLKLARWKTMVPSLTCSFQMVRIGSDFIRCVVEFIVYTNTIGKSLQVLIILLDLYMCLRCHGIWFKMWEISWTRAMMWRSKSLVLTGDYFYIVYADDNIIFQFVVIIWC